MNKKKSFKDLVNQMGSLQESELGQLKGGFAAFKTLSTTRSIADGSVTVTVARGETCTCTCKIKSPSEIAS